MAAWIKDENWHAQQTMQMQEDGSVLLTLPIGHHLTELVRDLLRYASEIEILHPPRLKQAIAEQLQLALAKIGS